MNGPDSVPLDSYKLTNVALQALQPSIKPP